jgi:hypothetical protein
MINKTASTYWVKIYSSGSIETAKQIIREDVLQEGLCVTIEPTTFIYTGGEEVGFVVGLVNYPRFPSEPEKIKDRAMSLAMKLLEGTYQHSTMIMTPEETIWITKREA